MPALPQTPANGDVLNSWKDIARYLDRGVRTVQRWELELALPVRRPRGKPHSGVLALRSDLDRWLGSCPAARNQAQGDCSPAHEVLEPSFQNTSDLVSHSRMLRTELVRVRHDLRLTVNRLATTVRSFRAEPSSAGEPQA